MIKVSNEELTKISQFLTGCEDMINGKFILAETKIKKILNMVAESQELYRFMSECLMNYDFTREFFHASVRNNLNNGVFQTPKEPAKIVAFVFCFFVECDAGRMDFYSFINDNFKSESKKESYKIFTKELLIPFKDVIASHFSLGGVGEEEVNQLADEYRQDLKNNPIFETNEAGQTNYETQFYGHNYQNANQYENGFAQNEQSINQNQYFSRNMYANGNQGYDNSMSYEQAQNYNYNQNTNQTNYDGYISNKNLQNENIENGNITSNTQTETESKQKENDVWDDFVEICENIESAVYAERHLKQYLKDELLYILGTIKYSVKYKDVRIISALATAFDELSKKFRSIQMVFGELKNKLQSLYQ